MAWSVNSHKQAPAAVHTVTKASIRAGRRKSGRSGGRGGGKYRLGKTVYDASSLKPLKQQSINLRFVDWRHFTDIRVSPIDAPDIVFNIITGLQSLTEESCFLTGFVANHFIAIY